MLDSICPILIKDFYKVHHPHMYEPGMTKLYSNLTPRKSRLNGVNHIVVFGTQYFIKEHLIDNFNKNFFQRNINVIIDEYKFITGLQDVQHIVDLHKLGYLPLEIKALSEGTLCPIGVPCMTITNTHKKFGWLVNNLETYISTGLWQGMTSATIAYEYKKLLTKYALETDKDNVAFVDWQGHDFSMRGMSSVESSIVSGMGHLLSFTGTDTIPAIWAHKKYYNPKGLIGASVPATEHSVMCMGTKDSEINTFSRLLDLYPEGILSVVSDTWDLWKVCTEYLSKLKDKILARDGKLVIRPDSGDPVDIICGRRPGNMGVSSVTHQVRAKQEEKGVIELLWDIFGGTINSQGYRVLDSHIGAIYGDSITLDRAKEICERLKAKGFASTNIVLGIGSYTYQYNTRDIFGFAMKATYGEITHKVKAGEVSKIFGKTLLQDGIEVEPREIFKDPITDDGTKKSKKGLLAVYQDEVGELFCQDQCTWEMEKSGELETVFLNGRLVKETTLDEIRDKLSSYKY